MEKKGWDKIKNRLPKEYKWKKQVAKKRNKKGRAKGRMLMGIRKGIEVKSEEGEIGKEGIMIKKDED